MRNYHDQQYAQISPLLPQIDTSDASDISDDELAADNNDLDHSLGAPLRRGDTIAAAMDKLNLVLMYHHGITPQEATVTPKTLSMFGLNVACEARRKEGWEYRLALVGPNRVLALGYKMILWSCDLVQWM